METNIFNMDVVSDAHDTGVVAAKPTARLDLFGPRKVLIAAASSLQMGAGDGSFTIASDHLAALTQVYSALKGRDGVARSLPAPDPSLAACQLTDDDVAELTKLIDEQNLELNRLQLENQTLAAEFATETHRVLDAHAELALAVSERNALQIEVLQLKAQLEATAIQQKHVRQDCQIRLTRALFQAFGEPSSPVT